MEMPKFNVKIYKGDNSISLTKTDSGILGYIRNNKVDNVLVEANLKQYLSYHLIRIISDSFDYLDINIYNLINSYIYNIPLNDYLYKEGGQEALKINLITEIYKLSQLLLFYQKPLKRDIESIKEEIDAMVSKVFKNL